MAAPRKKPPVKKTPKGKKPSFLRKDTSRPARDVKPGDLRSQASQGPKKTGVKSPAETRRSISRKQTGTSRPARDLNKGGLRAQYLKNAGESAASRTLGTVLRTGLRVAGPVGALVSMTGPAGEGSTVPGQAQKAVEKKMKREIRQGPALAVTGVREGIIGKTRSLRNKTGQNRPEYPTWKNKPKASESSSSAQIGLNKPPRWREDASWKYNAPIGPKKKSASSSTYSGYGTSNVPKKSGSSDAFTLGSGAQTTGGNPVSRAAPKPNLRPRKVASSAPVGRLTRTEREGLSTDRMQRKPKGNLLGFLKKRK